MKNDARLYVIALVAAVGLGAAALAGSAQSPDSEEYRARSPEFSARMEADGLAGSFTGVTTSGEVVPGLFEIRPTGVSTAPVVAAAERLLGALTAEQRPRTRA
jgi:hypothetical protein